MATPPETPTHLGVALLSLLARGSRTGYDLAKAMQRPVGYFWSATRSQIYGELHRLADHGLVAVEHGDGPGPRPKATYSLTRSGSTVLRTWLLDPGSPPPMRDLESLRVFTLWMLPAAEALEVVDELERQHREVLDRYRAEMADLDAAGPFEWGTPGAAGRFALEGGIRTRQAQVEWCGWMRSQLES